ncbi:MAG: hypothetical protein K6G33_02365 [Ruminococcus sp.]|uniref:transglutaminase domain-containing protein n=1 Tax=Ruminococcus sp. TaxID=41978 RepID=UPI0025DF1F6E|nr:transglutaminase domain-containing protein [Ruminococcus sp.]MCR5599572.1 hypothetical protein [Ruminococcus sp.]
MEKKIISAAAAIVLAGGLYMSGRYIKDSGILRGYPAAEYLTSDEAEHRPVYEMLSKDEKAVYTALYRGISDKKEKIPLPMEIDGDEYSKIYCILEKQESSFFYLDSVYYTAQKVRDAKVVYREKSNAVLKASELDAVIDTAMTGTADYWSDAEKVRYINDYIVKKCNYVTGDDSEYASTSYGCLVRGEANCEGYAKAFRLLASQLDLDSTVVTGKTDKGENHAWNQVKVDDEWYNIDVTWADTGSEGDISLTYFLCSDADFSRTHIADKSLFEPYSCGRDDRNYYIANGLYAQTYNEAEEILRRELLADKSVVTIKFANESIYNDFYDLVNDDRKMFDIIKETEYHTKEAICLDLGLNEQGLCITLKFKFGE